MTAHLAAESLIACWRFWQNRQTAGSRAVYDAVNELWCVLARNEAQWQARVWDQR